jgi:hypothetical protein
MCNDYGNHITYSAYLSCIFADPHPRQMAGSDRSDLEPPAA